MLSAVIADPEAASTASLRAVLLASGRVRVVGEARSGAECVRLVARAAPHVLFADVCVPGLPGPALAEAMAGLPRPPLIVFMSSHDEHAIGAFEIGAADFVMKDADPERLGRRLAMTLDRLERTVRRAQPSLRTEIGPRRGRSKRPGQSPASEHPALLPVRDASTGVIRLLDAQSIVCAERNGRRVDIRTSDAVHPTYYTIARLAERLGPHGFVLASRSRVVNVARIDHLVPNGDGSYDAVMNDRARTTVTVSRHHAQWLIQALQP